MTISATKIQHSISPDGIELKTVLCRYPRFIHAEELTHRILTSSPDEIVIQSIADGVMYDRNLSRNASSSRAIPVKRLIDDVLRDTAIPIHWGKNQKGMQADEECNALVDLSAAIGVSHPFTVNPESAWFHARDTAIAVARAFDAAGYHKQIVNRLLEPFSHINVLITATDWDNFFELRDHKDAQPEIQALAKAIKAAFADSEPELLQPGQWHLPFITVDDVVQMIDYLRNGIKLNPTDDRIRDRLIQVSVARCARTSYLTHDGRTPEIQEDLALYERLVGARPLHASPAEHQATPDALVPGQEGPYGEWRVEHWKSSSLHGNFRGWIQNRKLLERQFA